jgi:hypothetical protein
MCASKDYKSREGGIYKNASSRAFIPPCSHSNNGRQLSDQTPLIKKAGTLVILFDTLAVIQQLTAFSLLTLKAINMPFINFNYFLFKSNSY